MTPERPAEPGVRAEPIDGRRCCFVVDRPVYPGRWVYAADRASTRGSPLAERLFGIEGVASVLLAHDRVTVTQTEAAGPPLLGGAVRVLRALSGDRSAGAQPWKWLGRNVGAAIRAHLASGVPAVGEDFVGPRPTEAELRARVQTVLDEQVNPVVAGHGGGVSILDVRDNVLYLQLWGGCQGCGLADQTLKHGVEAAVRDAVPEIGEIFDLTDHASGRNPYRPARSRR